MKYLFEPFVKSIFLLLTTIVIVSCQNDLLEDKPVESNSEIQVTKIYAKEIFNNKVLTNELEKLSNLKKNSYSKVVYSQQHDFSIDTDEAIYIEYEDYHSYTFSIYRNNNSELTENLVLSLQEDLTYEAYIVSYDLTDEEKELIENNEYVDTVDKTTITLIENFDTSSIFNKDPLENCYEWGVIQESQGTGWDVYGWTEVPCEDDEEQNNEIDAGDSSGGGGNTSNDDNGFPDPTDDYNTGQGGGGNSDSSGSSSTDNTNPPAEGEECVLDANGNCLVDNLTTPLLDSNDEVALFVNFVSELSQELQDFINNLNNNELKEEIQDFLEENSFSAQVLTEAGMRVTAEYVNDPNNPKWNESVSGIYDNNPALHYDAIYDLPMNQGGGRYYRLIRPNDSSFDHKNVLYAAPGPRVINPEDAYSIPPSDIPIDGAHYYVYNYDLEKWYEFGLPTVTPDCLSCSLNDFFDAVLENTLVVVGRYFIPFEDTIILITGEDFYGAEQSRAAAGGFILLEIIPGTKAIRLLKTVRHADEVIQVATVALKYVDEIYQTQKQNVQNVLDGVWVFDLDEFGNTIRKGNFGEMSTDVDLFAKGYEPLHVRRTDIDEPLDQGIDHVFKNPQTDEFIIVESKYNTSSLSTLANGVTQMSDEWIEGGNRLIDAVGDANLADDIIDEGYTRVLANILPDGTMVYKELNSSGLIIGNWIP